MAEKNNAECSICGSQYYRCMSCRDSINANPWKMYTDTAEHYKVFQVIRGYNTKVYNKDEARIKLKNINLDDLESFRPHIKQIVKDILKEEKNLIKDVLKEEPVVEEIAIEEKQVVKTTTSRKRNYKVEI